MVETSANHKRSVFHICLHKGFAHERLFLQRNIRHALDAHEEILARVTAFKDPPELNGGMVANERTAAGWNYPTPAVLEGLMKGEKPVLSIDGLRIRHPQSKAKTNGRSGGHGEDGCEHLEWLPSPDVGFVVPCTVVIHVVNPAIKGDGRDVCYESRQATIKEEKTNGVSDYGVELDSPFRIEIGKLSTATETGTRGYRWNWTVATEYLLRVTIRCQDNRDYADLVYELEGDGTAGRDRRSLRQIPATAGLLTASWNGLPECPKPGESLILERPSDQKSGEPWGLKALEPAYKLEVAMGWTKPYETPLQRYNQKCEKASRLHTQLPTPTSSDGHDTALPRHEIIYKYEDGLFTRTSTVQGLACPLCPGKRAHSSMDRLRLHCATYHDHFKFETEDTVRQTQGSDVTRHIVWISLSQEDTNERRNQPRTLEKMHWIAPQRPFNIAAQLSGEDNWMGTPRSKAKDGRGRPPKGKGKESPSMGPPRPVRKRPAPEDLEDLTDDRPAKRRVPNVPGIKFYHTTSKQSIAPDSLVSNSDEDIDESWLNDRASRDLEDAGITGVAKEFSLLFDAHLEREQPETDLFAKEALIRFVRKYQLKLQDLEWQQLFRKKLRLLHEHNVIGHETLSYCLQQLEDRRRTTPARSEAHATAGAEEEQQVQDADTTASGLTDGRTTSKERKRWANGRMVNIGGESGMSPPMNSEELLARRKSATPRTNGVPQTNGAPPTRQMSATPQTNGVPHVNGTPTPNGVSTISGGSPQPPPQSTVKGLCTCGKSAAWQRATIACADPRCLRKDFHLTCVGLEQRVQGWRCLDCA
ncbi:hypothetical protein LTR09_003269 [Extremus antarcticus]|uniref:Polycomb protein VEFS-Box domain-containing protein n=1 Tax=Extremus antarcticus TaxID=702011 RepID=A0AAJ0GEM4_9PEZI|nr:hypothetical protein LTR09_003269 [Extremus antarcticus]